MNMSPRKKPFSLSARHIPFAACIASIALALSGCGGPAQDEPHGHDHAAEAAHAHDHAPSPEHDHAPAAEGEHAHVDEVHLTPEAVARYGVRTGRAAQTALQDSVLAPARVAYNAETMAHVGSPLRGRVVQMKVRLGDGVTAGQELLVIESPELGEAQADLLQRRAAVLAAAPAAELAKAAWERAKGLHERSQGIALGEVQRREAEYRGAMAAQRAAEAAATAAQNRLQLMGMSKEQVDALLTSGEISGRFAIKAPIDATVVQREITLGELVGPDRESLLVLADTRSPWVLADVSEASLPRVVPGTRAWITLGTAGADRLEGTVVLVASSIDPSTRTASVRIEIPKGGSALKPGMFVQAEMLVPVNGGAQVVAVPDEAVQTVEGGPAVFVPVKDEPNTFAARPVRVGKTIGGMVPILEGLAPDEEVVVAGSFILKAELGKAGAAHEH